MIVYPVYHQRRQSMWIWITILLFWIMALAGCTSSGPRIRVENAWARPSTEMVSMGGVFLTIANDGEADRLTGARSDVAKMVELHETTMANEKMTMRQVSAIEVPARSRVELKPGGYHIMLIGLTRDLKAGERIPLTLYFERSGELTIHAEVRP